MPRASSGVLLRHSRVLVLMTGLALLLRTSTRRLERRPRTYRHIVGRACTPADRVFRAPSPCHRPPSVDESGSGQGPERSPVVGRRAVALARCTSYDVSESFLHRSGEWDIRSGLSMCMGCIKSTSPPDIAAGWVGFLESLDPDPASTVHGRSYVHDSCVTHNCKFMSMARRGADAGERFVDVGRREGRARNTGPLFAFVSPLGHRLCACVRASARSGPGRGSRSPSPLTGSPLGRPGMGWPTDVKASWPSIPTMKDTISFARWWAAGCRAPEMG